MAGLSLYTYYRSSASYRVRIAMSLKGLKYESKFIHLPGKEHKSDQFLALNPQGLVPVLELDGQLIHQSLAIIEYLDAMYPKPALLPDNELEKAKVRAVAQIMACDIHPLNNLRVLQYLKNELNHEQEQVDEWYRHWVIEGFKALENIIVANNSNGHYCFGDTPGLADICLVPQMYNARRFNTDLSAFPNLMRIDKFLCSLPAFQQASPENQADAT